ncbi:MAG: hypothetical protein LBE30_14970 [Comamonas sp.]|jgi:hypothetical protein|nr:hypothetical protein [Comamonas sp.]
MSIRYHAPAVSYGFERPRRAAAALVLLWLLLAMVLLVWCHMAQWRGGPLLAACVVLILATGMLLGQWREWPQGLLQWNGEQWQIDLPDQPDKGTQFVRLKVGLDGGNWLWLSASSLLPAQSLFFKRKVLWILLRQQHSPAQWGDLRRAVYSSVVLLAKQG